MKYIYTLSDPETKWVKYIGQTDNPDFIMELMTRHEKEVIKLITESRGYVSDLLCENEKEVRGSALNQKLEEIELAFETGKNEDGSIIRQIDSHMSVIAYTQYALCLIIFIVSLIGLIFPPDNAPQGMQTLYMSLIILSGIAAIGVLKRDFLIKFQNNKRVPE